MTTEHVSVPREDYEVLVKLARRCLHAAFVWNDHNFGPVKDMAKADASGVGIRSLDEADEFIDKLHNLSRATPSDVCGRCGAASEAEAETRCIPDGDSCPGCEKPLSDTWEKPSAPRVVSDELVQLVADDLDGIFAIEDIQEPAFLDDVRRIVQRIAEELATSLPAAIPPGYVVVPVEPLNELLEASIWVIRSVDEDSLSEPEMQRLNVAQASMHAELFAAAPQAGEMG